MAAHSSRGPHHHRDSTSPERPGRLCKVRFEGSSSPHESPRSKWRRFGRLSLLRQARRDSNKAQPVQQQPKQTVPMMAPLTISEEESSSNSTPNLTEHRLSMQAEMAAAAVNRSVSQTGNSSYLMMVHSSSASTSPAGGQSMEDKRQTKAGDRLTRAKSCMFGILHVETGARLFLLFYIFLSACGVAFGSVATMVWILVPLVVIPLAAYSLSRHASKYLYPLLIISIIHSLVALLMVLIVGSFSLLCFDQLKAHFAHSMAAFPSGAFPSSSFTALCCALTMALSLGLALFFFWQSIVLFSCINHFDLLAQQRRQQQQQIQQQMAKTTQSIPLDQRQAAAAVSRQMECSQCISEIRQLGQFTGNGQRATAPNRP